MSTKFHHFGKVKFLLAIGLEPILLLLESDFKSDVSTNSTKRAFVMAQFEVLIIFPLIWALLVTLFFYYKLSIELMIPIFFGTKKFREKKLKSSVSKILAGNLKTELEYSYAGAN